MGHVNTYASVNALPVVKCPRLAGSFSLGSNSTLALFILCPLLGAGAVAILFNLDLGVDDFGLQHRKIRNR